MAKTVVVYSDFDETMIKENSPILIGLAIIKFNRQKVGIWSLPRNFPKMLWHVLRYKMTGRTEHFYKLFFYFDDDLLDEIAKKLKFHPKWIAAIEDIQKKNKEAGKGKNKKPKIELTIITRNIHSIVKKFIDLHKAKFDAWNIEIKEIIAHSDIISGTRRDILITAGVWGRESKEPIVDVSKFPGKRKITAAETVVPMGFFSGISDSIFEAKIAGTIEEDKHLYFRESHLPEMYYIGDKEDEYLLKHGISKERFYRI